MNYKLNVLRALAILMVMFGHSIIIYQPSWNLFSSPVVPPPPFLMLKAWFGVVQMPLFMAISGYLYYYSIEKHASLIEIIESKSLRLLAPLFLVGFLYSIPIKAAIGVPHHNIQNLSDLLDIFCFFLQGIKVIAHLWFLPTLMAIMLLGRFVLTDEKDMLRDIVLFLTAFTLSLFAWSNRNCFPYSYQINAYLVSFILGFLVSKYKLDKARHLWPAAAVILLVIALYIYPNRYGKLLMPLPLIYLLLKYTPFWNNGILNKISSNSFGLYLFHSPLVYFAFKNFPNINPWIMLFFNFFVCGSIAWGLTELCRKTCIGRIIIGEYKFKKKK